MSSPEAFVPPDVLTPERETLLLAALECKEP